MRMSNLVNVRIESEKPSWENNVGKAFVEMLDMDTMNLEAG